MNRNAYIGDVGGAAAVPIHPDARAYFERMTTPPTPAFREAFNWAVGRWVKIGVWKGLVKGLWILAADTSQAALLSAIGDTPRDAVVVGTAPTFTARKGFSGFSATKQVKFPITATILASDDVYSFAALKASEKYDGGIGVNHYGAMIQCDGGANYQRPGNYEFVNAATQGISFGGIASPSAQTLLVGGGKAGRIITPGIYDRPIGAPAATPSARSSNYITTAHAVNNLDLLSAYGFLDAAATVDQCRKFISVLSAMLEQLGALD
jgi:hypothetical protein